MNYQPCDIPETSECDCAPDMPHDRVTDYREGTVVCRRCGVVLASHLMCGDPYFQGEACAGLLERAPHVIVYGRGNPRKRARAVGLPDGDAHRRAMLEGLESMGHMFPATVVHTAQTLLVDLTEKRGRSINREAWPKYCAAALRLASNMHPHLGRTRKHIAELFGPHGVDEQHVTGTAKDIRIALSGMPYAKQLLGSLEAEDLINGCVLGLGLPDKKLRFAVEKRAHDLMLDVQSGQAEGKSPASVCSGVIACAARLVGVKVTRRRIAEACKVCEATVKQMEANVEAWRRAGGDNGDEERPFKVARPRERHCT